MWHRGNAWQILIKWTWGTLFHTNWGEKQVSHGPQNHVPTPRPQSSLVPMTRANLDSQRAWFKSESHSVVSDSLWPHGPQSPWSSPGQNSGVDTLSLLQGIFPTQVSLIAGRFFISWAIRKPKNAGVGSLSLLQGIFLIQESNQGLLQVDSLPTELWGKPVNHYTPCSFSLHMLRAFCTICHWRIYQESILYLLLYAWCSIIWKFHCFSTNLQLTNTDLVSSIHDHWKNHSLD